MRGTIGLLKVLFVIILPWDISKPEPIPGLFTNPKDYDKNAKVATSVIDTEGKTILILIWQNLALPVLKANTNTLPYLLN